MYLIRRRTYLIFLLATSFVGCDRSEANFTIEEMKGQFVTTKGLLNPIIGDTLKFERQDMRNLSYPPEMVYMSWSNDTIIGDDTIHQLLIDQEGVDIILPEKLLLLIDRSSVRRYVKNYRYPLFILPDINTVDSSINRSFGVNPHWFTYWWKSPLEIVESNGLRQAQITTGIDSFRVNAEWAKFVQFKFTHGKGITDIEQLKMYVAVSNDTISHYHLKRID